MQRSIRRNKGSGRDEGVRAMNTLTSRLSEFWKLSFPEKKSTKAEGE